MCSQSLSKKIWRSCQHDNDLKDLGYMCAKVTFCQRKVMNHSTYSEGNVPMPTNLRRKFPHVPPMA